TRQRHVAVRLGIGAFQTAQLLAHDASAVILIAERGRERADAAVAGDRRGLQQLADHRVLDVGEDLGKRLGLEVVGVDVDDRKALVAALARLLGGVRQRDAGIELVDAHASVIAERQFHQTSSKHEESFGIMLYSVTTNTSPPRSITV